MKRAMTSLVAVLLTGSCTFLGCSSSQKKAVLSSEEALAVAVQLANGQALQLFEVQPFHTNCAEIQRTDQGWQWKALTGHGKADLVANVSFRPDGSEPLVSVEMFTSAVTPSFHRLPAEPPNLPGDPPRPIPERMPEKK